MDSKVISLLGESIVAIAVNLFTFLLFKQIYNLKYKNKIIYIASFAISVALMLIINQLRIPIFNIAYTFIFVNVICVLLFECRLIKGILYNTLFVLILFFCDISTVMLWSAIKGIHLMDILAEYQLMLFSNLLNVLIMFLAYKLYITVLTKKEMSAIRFKESVFLILMTAFEVFVVYSFALKVSSQLDGIRIIAILIGFLSFNIFVTYIIRQISLAYKYKYELALSQQQIKIQLLHYQEINKKYQDSRKIIHDIKKHLAILNSLRENKDFEKAEKYSSLISSEIERLYGGFHCSNQILSIVMTQKIMTAEYHKIKINTQVQDIPFDFMADIDITALFANLWDNAIEACLKLDYEKRYIQLTINQINNFIIINMENSFDNVINKKDRRILSTKKGHEGIGLSSIETVIEKYDGMLTTNISDKIFLSEITIPIPLNIKDKTENRTESK